MTSDSETDYKYTSTSSRPVSETTAHASPCPEGELRCVDGRCISVDQLCDKVKYLILDQCLEIDKNWQKLFIAKVADCTDGSDEVMCTYTN
jgi:hypothetical protein